jgi:hypothetical protein
VDGKRSKSRRTGDESAWRVEIYLIRRNWRHGQKSEYRPRKRIKSTGKIIDVLRTCARRFEGHDVKQRHVIKLKVLARFKMYWM